MSNIFLASTLESLKPFLNEKNVLEIVIRDRNKRIKAIQKVMLNGQTQEKSQELVNKAMNLLNKNTDLSQKSLDMIRHVANLQNLNLVLNGLNLCATCAGFAIMYAKLDSMSAEISQQISRVNNTVKKGHDVHTGYEFNKVLGEYTDMLDCRRKQHPYSEEKMRELVDREYNVLNLLISVLKNDISANHQATITSIFSMLSMFTVSLKYFDELYYFNNHIVLGDKNVWHSSHNKWMDVYEILSSEWFVEILQDYAVLETQMDMPSVDVYYTELFNQVEDLRQDVEDNQQLILAIGDIEVLHTLKESNTQDIKETIKAAFDESFQNQDDPEVLKTYDEALKELEVM